MAFKFEELSVWQKALVLTKEVHDLTKDFPKEELYVLSSQMKRAADSIVLNIAEGSTGQSDPEFRKFIGYAVRSGMEVVACLHIGKMREIITEEDFSRFYNQLEEITKMLQALKKSIK